MASSCIVAEPFYNGQARVETGDGRLLVITEDGEVERFLRKGRIEPASDDFPF